MLRLIPMFLERGFLAIAFSVSVLALWHPEWFTWVKPYIPMCLGIIMFGMGLTLNFEDFRDILRKWKLVGLGMILQYTIMPLLAVGISSLLGLPTSAMVGMVVVGACPGGTASNVIAYIARANVPLSVTMTLASTALAPLLTPIVIYLLLDQKVSIDFWGMMRSVFWIVLFPLLDGLVLRRLFRKHLDPVLSWFPSVSIVVISLLIACIIGLNRANLLAFPVLVFLAVVLHNVLGLGTGYFVARLTGCKERDARTLAIEVGMQNSGLGVALASSFFTAASALPAALFSLWHNISGVCLANFWRRSDS